jgi:hypothetical protein
MMSKTSAAATRRRVKILQGKSTTDCLPIQTINSRQLVGTALSCGQFIIHQYERLLVAPSEDREQFWGFTLNGKNLVIVIVLMFLCCLVCPTFPLIAPTNACLLSLKL